MSNPNEIERFGQEILTQELVTFEKVHVNVSQALIITTEDRMHLWLQDVISRAKKRFAWITPLSLVIAITLSLTTATFKKLILPADTWYAIFIIADIVSFIWLIIAFSQSSNSLELAAEISRLKTFTPAESLSSKGVGKNG